MRIVFGVMSNKWEIIADDLLTAKIAMALHIGKKIPIAIYEPMEDGFIPTKDFVMEHIEYNRSGVMEAQRSIKILRTTYNTSNKLEEKK